MAYLVYAWDDVDEGEASGLQEVDDHRDNVWGMGMVPRPYVLRLVLLLAKVPRLDREWEVGLVVLAWGVLLELDT